MALSITGPPRRSGRSGSARGSAGPRAPVGALAGAVLDPVADGQRQALRAVAERHPAIGRAGDERGPRLAANTHQAVAGVDPERVVAGDGVLIAGTRPG